MSRKSCLIVSVLQLCTASILLYDLRYTSQLEPQEAYEEAHFVSALCGLANRDTNRLYVSLTAVDDQWMDVFNIKLTENVTSLESLLEKLQSSFKGAVLYDMDVPATSAIASTIAGADALLPIAYRPSSPHSLYSRLVTTKKLSVVTSLVGKFTGNVTGSAKNDAYAWAIDHYLAKGRTNPRAMAYYVDSFWTTLAKPGEDYLKNTVSNHDFFIKQRAFFWDLNVWGDEVPVDDPKQPLGTDRATLVRILNTTYQLTQGKEFVHLGGFTPWAFKYVTAKHEGVATEWELSKLLSAFNVYVDADACCVGAMANSAFYSNLMSPEAVQRHGFPHGKWSGSATNGFSSHTWRLRQNPAPSRQSLVEQGYLDAKTGNVTAGTYAAIYVGDYDSAAWVYSQLWQNWNDPQRGKIPLGWAINPNLSERFPAVFPLLYASLTPNDRLISGDSGAGYVNPTQLLPPRDGNPTGSSARDMWVARNTGYYSRHDISFSGFLINGAAGHMTSDAEEMYTSFSWNGIVEQSGYSQGPWHFAGNNTPVFFENDLPDDATAAGKVMAGVDPNLDVSFQVFRSVLKSPSWHVEAARIAQKLTPTLYIVDPLVLGYLARAHAGLSNDNRVTYMSDDLLLEGDSFVTIRNEGWNSITPESNVFGYSRNGGPYKFLSLPSAIEPAETVTFQLGLELMENDLVTYQLFVLGQRVPFAQFGNIPLTSRVAIHA